MDVRTKSSLSRASVLAATTRGTGGKCSTKPDCLLSDTHHVVAGGQEFPWKPSPAELMDTEKSPESNFSKASFAELLVHSYKPD